MLWWAVVSKVRHEKINLDIKNLTHDLLRPLFAVAVWRGGGCGEAKVFKTVEVQVSCMINQELSTRLVCKIDLHSLESAWKSNMDP